MQLTRPGNFNLKIRTSHEVDSRLISNHCRCNAERQKVLAERAELEEFQKTQQELRERELDERIRAETRNPSIVVSFELRI